MARRELPNQTKWWTGVIVVVLSGAVAIPAVAVSIWAAQVTAMTEPVERVEVDIEEFAPTVTGPPDAPAEIVAAYPEYLVLPGDVSASTAMEHVAQSFERLRAQFGGEPGADLSLVAQTYESFAHCAWVVEWLDAESLADGGRMTAAANWMGSTDNFPALAAADGGGVVDAMLGFAAAARAEDRAGVEKADSGGCEWVKPQPD